MFYTLQALAHPANQKSFQLVTSAMTRFFLVVT